MRIVNKDMLYRISMEGGTCRVVEVETEKELLEYLARLTDQTIITSVNHLEIYTDAIRSPKYAFRNHPYYKKIRKEIEENKKF